MVWLTALLIILAALLCVRIRVSVEILWDGRMESCVTVYIERFRLPDRKKRPQGVSTARPGRKKRAARILLRTVRRHDRCRKLLLNCIHPELISCRALTSLPDAAGTALLTGALRGALALFPARWRKSMHVSVLPDFFSSHTRFQLHCIFFAHLGRIALCAAVLIPLFLWERHKAAVNE